LTFALLVVVGFNIGLVYLYKKYTQRHTDAQVQQEVQDQIGKYFALQQNNNAVPTSADEDEN
jgi:uncharacterized membrane protein